LSAEKKSCIQEHHLLTSYHGTAAVSFSERNYQRSPRQEEGRAGRVNFLLRRYTVSTGGEVGEARIGSTICESVSIQQSVSSQGETDSLSISSQQHSSSEHAGRTWAARAAETGAGGAVDGGFLGTSGGTSMAAQ